ncbi:MAG TPA: hypothetical protein HA326_03825 [Thermoplasmata archaeon]|nr:hypothetical protein [Thermoplasmata archaeon]
MNALMESSTASTVSKRVTDSWRELGRMHASQVLVVLGSAIAVFAGIVVYLARAVSEGSPAVVSFGALWLFVFGLLGLLGYVVSRASLRNGAIVSGVAGLALLLLAGDVAGLLTGIVVLLGAAWAFVRSL